MRRHLLVAALVIAAAGSLGSGTASAYCDPDYRPLCLNDCRTRLPDPSNPAEILTRVCPA